MSLSLNVQVAPSEKMLPTSTSAAVATTTAPSGFHLRSTGWIRMC